MPLDLEKYDEAVKTWGKNTRDAMIAKGKSMGIEHRSNSPSKGESLTKIKDKYKSSHGAIDVVRFSNINRSLIYTSVGAGKGIGGYKGSTWIDKYGKSKKTNSDSLNKLGTGNRKAKNFMLEALDGPGGITELETIVSENLADAVVNFKPKDVLQDVTLKK